ncbi:MAG: hypothetical protein IRY87_04180 [Acetobacteraceae bacterium]|nr:hypothetical protein [Acetobacteraceae bacterium]
MRLLGRAALLRRDAGAGVDLPLHLVEVAPGDIALVPLRRHCRIPVAG